MVSNGPRDFTRGAKENPSDYRPSANLHLLGFANRLELVIELLELRGRKKLPLEADIFSLVSD